MMNIEKQLVPEQDRKTIPADSFGFGKIFSDHMLTRVFSQGTGWQDPKIVPYGPISMELSAAVFHYGQEIFEGTKAYRRPDGGINLFRTMENVKRFNRSAARMDLPVLDEEEHLESIISLVSLDHKWVPSTPQSTLYIRPTMISTETSIGSVNRDEVMFFVLLSPVDPFHTRVTEGIKTYVEPLRIRAAPGGVGAAKTGGNYAAGMLAQKEASKAGFNQVLWLDAINRRFVEENGGSNIFFVYGDHLRTPALTDTILPGITRDSIIQLGRDLGYTVTEEALDINEVMADIEAGKCTEAFNCGTAAVITPVGELSYKETSATISGRQIGRVTKHILDELTGIQFGRIPDRFGWTIPVERQ